jgi:DNA-binding SARP family transcriptional activator
MRIYVTGQLAIEAGGCVLRERDLPGGQGRIVLAMLAVEHRRPLTREELADELWPERLPRSWETALRAVVSKVRASFASAGIGTSDPIGNAFGCYRLRLPPAARLDLDEAVDALHAAETELRLGDAAAAGVNATVTSLICRRPFLPGVYGSWTLAQRERIRGLRLRAEECLADAWAENGEFARSARAAEQALALDPYREVLYRRLIHAHALAGDRAAAAHAYRRCREVLARELGIRPAPATEALFRAAVTGAAQ